MYKTIGLIWCIIVAVFVIKSNKLQEVYKNLTHREAIVAQHTDVSECSQNEKNSIARDVSNQTIKALAKALIENKEVKLTYEDKTYIVSVKPE